MPVLRIPEVEGVEYLINDKTVKGDVEVDGDVVVTAVPLPGYRFEDVTDTDWDITVSEDAPVNPE